MTDDNLKNLTIDELFIMLTKSQKILASSRFYHQSDEEIDINIRQVEKLQRAIEEKRSVTNYK